MDDNLIAIGDIHGLAKTLERLLERVPKQGLLIFLGDYIDRGPSSNTVISRLLRLQGERECIFLRGNHEAMALEALEGNLDAEMAWQRNGGLQTLRSYNYEIPDEHLDFLQRTRPYYLTDRYIFVHGGLLPEYQPDELEEMGEEELFWWVREPFLSTDYDWGRQVIHGHTPTANGRPDVHANRINIDTGAVYGGHLTALVLPKRKFISVPANERK